jgi:oxygen-dependent protoporphyrinogen oxidase
MAEAAKVETSEKRVTVIGAGFSGLTAAFYLRRAGYSVEVIEAQARAGGLIDTVHTPFGLAETAANGLLNSHLVEDLFRAIGAELIGTRPEARRRYIYREGRPRRWPLGFVATLRMIGFAFRFLFARASVSPKAFEPVQAWGRRVMGEEASSFTLETFLQGIYAGDARRMSARLIFGPMFQSSREKNSAASPGRKKRFRGTVSARGGMGEVIRCLRATLEREGVTFRFDEPQRLATQPAWPHVIATNARDAGQVLAAFRPEVARDLEKVELLPLITTTVAFREPLPQPGFGCLFPPSENRRVLGVLMNNDIFDGRAKEGYSETWIMGGARGEERVPGFLDKSDDEILAVIEGEREACFGVKSERLGARITRWPAALPHYTVELERTLATLESQSRGERANIFFMGNWLGQIGLAKILERASRLPEAIATQGSWT